MKHIITGSILAALVFVAAPLVSLRVSSATARAAVARQPNVAPAPGVKVRSVQIVPGSVVGGTQNVVGIVTLTGRAPDGGVIVTLSCVNSDTVVIPDRVTVAGGRTAATFVVTTQRVSDPKPVTIRASVAARAPQGGAGNETQSSATLTVRPVSIGTLTLVPGTIAAGESAEGFVSLDATPVEPVRITLSCEDPLVVLSPARATLAKGVTDLPFSVQVPAADKARTITITATANRLSRAATLKIEPSRPESVSRR